MPIIRQLTEAEADLQVKESLILQAGEATHHLASVMAATNQRFWQLPIERLITVLNADVPATLATFAANTALGQQVNTSLDALGVPQFNSRAPVEPGRSDVTFDGTQFVYVPSAEPEPLAIEP